MNENAIKIVSYLTMMPEPALMLEFHLDCDHLGCQLELELQYPGWPNTNPNQTKAYFSRWSL